MDFQIESKIHPLLQGVKHITRKQELTLASYMKLQEHIHLDKTTSISQGCTYNTTLKPEAPIFILLAFSSFLK